MQMGSNVIFSELINLVEEIRFLKKNKEGPCLKSGVINNGVKDFAGDPFIPRAN